MACRRFANAGSHPAKAPTRAATSAIFCVWEMIRHWQTLTKRCCKTMLVRPTIHGHFRVRQCRHPAACRGSVHHRAAFTIVQRSPSCSVHHRAAFTVSPTRHATSSHSPGRTPGKQQKASNRFRVRKCFPKVARLSTRESIEHAVWLGLSGPSGLCFAHVTCTHRPLREIDAQHNMRSTLFP